MIAHAGEGKQEGYVYILHFRSAVAGGRKYSRHYVGWAKDWTRRVKAHREGTSHARLMEVLHERGLSFDVAAVLIRLEVGELEVTGRDLERYIKKQHNHKRYCPLCGAKVRDYRE